MKTRPATDYERWLGITYPAANTTPQYGPTDFELREDEIEDFYSVHEQNHVVPVSVATGSRSEIDTHPTVGQGQGQDKLGICDGSVFARVYDPAMSIGLFLNVCFFAAVVVLYVRRRGEHTHSHTHGHTDGEMERLALLEEKREGKEGLD